MANKDQPKLKKFSPFQTLVFNSLAQEIKERPVIIFHDTEQNYYYYIKARDARLDDGRLKNPFQGEILIPKSDKPNTLFTKDSYLDCSQIFYIRDSELEELVKNHPETEILDSKELEFDQVEKMFNNIYECLTSKPPYIVISKVSYDSKTKTTKSEVQYASDWHLKNDYAQAIAEVDNIEEIKELEELKNKLHNEKNQLRLDLFETVLLEARREYRKEKVYNPLFEWITKNKFIQNGLNTIEIIHEYNRLSRPLVPATINGDTIYICLVNNKWEDRRDFSLSERLEQTNFKSMIDWFKKNDLDINMESFRQFRKSMQESQDLGELLYFYKLEEQLKQDLSKLEKKYKKDGPKMKM
ncbi:hypothetical protein NBX26_01750 [Mesomycoplasma hyopneumoniae]|uniref:Mbov_0400 family ICE element protein n=1 Tax=Mesomycoplasma hyopneumoniae TaxID=2099 RepID=UPI003857A8FF